MFEERAIPLCSYNIETSLAEKLETILTLSLQTTRMRDFYDIYAFMNSNREIDFALLGIALEATMTERGSAASLDRAEEIIELLESGEMMEERWNRYKASNEFAESATWQKALDSLRKMAENTRIARTV